MGMTGGIFGAAIGAVLGGPLGALIGGGIGSILCDCCKSAMYDPNDHQQAAEIKFELLSMLFKCMGKLAGSDGSVSKAETDGTREMLYEFYPSSPEKREKLMDFFNLGRNSSSTFEALTADLVRTLDQYPNTGNFREISMETFCVLAVSDREISPVEMALLYNAGQLLNASHVVKRFFQQPDRDFQYPRQPDGGQYRSSDNDPLTNAYLVLGVERTAGDEEIRKAYHQKAQEFHPDKVINTGLSEAFVKFAQKEFQKISDAYQIIQQSRNNK